MNTRVMNKSDKKAAAFAARVLRKGGIIVYPTETAYGIGADATNIGAIKKINKLKKRSNKLMPVILSEIKMAERYFFVDNEIKKLVKKFMPGPLTLAAKKRKTANEFIGGFRIPADKLASAISKKLGKPIIATSANLSGKNNIYKIKDIVKLFSGKVDLIIDAGNLRKRRPSTVFDVSERKLIRKGKISKREIDRVLG